MLKSETRSFTEFVQQESGQNILACYHCKKCTAGCPVAGFMDIQPNVLHRMIQLNRKNDILKSASIWVCAGCETCGARCPNDIDISKVMDTLKQLAVKEGIKGKEKKIPAFHSAFLNGVRRRGRMHEISLIVEMRLMSGGYFNDMKLAFDMFKKGKLNLIGEKVKNIKEVRALFKKAKRNP